MCGFHVSIFEKFLEIENFTPYLANATAALTR
jgi:hypothetical protein